MNLKHLILIAFAFLMPSVIFTQNLDFTFTISNSNCSSDGEITINVTGGKAPFCYDISSCPNCYTCINQNTYTFKGLPAGNHIITVSDNSVPQQKITKTITIGGNYKLPSIYSTSNKGIVTAIAKDGKRPYQYSISTDNGKTFSTPTI
ncbi:MAG: SprB repeat-containing protein [Saprospiraceae bacterium]|nr:SprB repeat-containing protein [Saprospiraceae bacterium]